MDRSLIKYLGMIFLGVLLTQRLPHNSYSIIQYIIRPIPIGNGVLYLSGLPILVLFIYSISKILKLERFAKKSKFFLFLIIVLVVIPLMRQSLYFIRTTYHTIAQSNLSAVDCNFDNSKINLNFQENGVGTINVRLELIDYGRSRNRFKVRIHVPDEWKKFFNVDHFELENLYFTHGYRDITRIQEEVSVQIAEGYTMEDVLSYDWYYQTFYYELYNDEESIMIINHGR